MADAATRAFSRPLSLAASVALVFSGCLAQASPSLRVLKDALGERAAIPEEPRRVVALAPSLAELASDLLGNELDRIVGVSEYTRYPIELAKRASIGPYSKPNLESIVALRPDLVLATTEGNPKETVQRLRELGVPVLVVKAGTMEEILDSMRLLGDALGRTAAAARMVAKLKAGVAEVQARASRRAARRKLLIQLQEDPVIVAGGRSFLGEMAALVGADLLYKEAPRPYPVVSLEDAVARKPDAVVIVAMDRLDDPRVVAIGRRWNSFPAVPAVANGRIRLLIGDRVTRPTLKLLEGLALLEKAVYGG